MLISIYNFITVLALQTIVQTSTSTTSQICKVHGGSQSSSEIGALAILGSTNKTTLMIDQRVSTCGC